MARTKSFRELVQSRVKSDNKFAEALLREGIDAMLSGDVETGKTILRDYIKATVGFEELGEAREVLAGVGAVGVADLAALVLAELAGVEARAAGELVEGQRAVLPQPAQQVAVDVQHPVTVLGIFHHPKS